ncbi:hypothetical protein TNCV_3222871 [Trichonephila clavipes]|nr:hypothetical protein TNCV_3222871 [Trichonephila clavipes]
MTNSRAWLSPQPLSLLSSVVNFLKPLLRRLQYSVCKWSSWFLSLGSWGAAARNLFRGVRTLSEGQRGKRCAFSIATFRIGETPVLPQAWGKNTWPLLEDYKVLSGHFTHPVHQI